MGRRKTKDEFKQEVFQLVKGDYIVLSDYTYAHVKVAMKHNSCGYTWNITPDSFLHGTRCPRCVGNERKTAKSFVEETFLLVGNEYSILSDYVHAHAKVKIRHNVCSYEWDVTPANFLHSRGCPRCGNCERKTQESFEKEIFDLVGNEYKVLSLYKTFLTKVKMRHAVCNHIWNITPANFIKGQRRCPVCASSKGEANIRNILKKNKVDFIEQCTFDDCKIKYRLRFDFYIKSNNTVVEYQGLQHYEPVDFANKGSKWAKEQFDKVKKYDSYKRKYCRKNGIALIEIPYWEFNNIETILYQSLFS